MPGTGHDESAYVAGLWKNPKFEERILGPDGEYPVLRRAMDKAANSAQNGEDSGMRARLALYERRQPFVDSSSYQRR